MPHKFDVGIIDTVKTAWQKGHPLSQTVFTSLYIDRLLWPEPSELDDATFGTGPSLPLADDLVHVVLRSYCLALIKSCDRIHQLISNQTYYEVLP